MTARADEILSIVQIWMRDAAGDQPTVERAIERAAMALGVSYSRAWSIWYGKTRRLWADEVAEMHERYQRVRAQKVATLRAELARLEAEEKADVDLAAPPLAPGKGRVVTRSDKGA